MRRKSKTKPRGEFNAIMTHLKSLANPRNVEGMARFGIAVGNALGISMVELRRMAKPLAKDHALAGRLWKSGVHEAMLLAGMLDEPAKVTAGQMKSWARKFASWDMCDQTCLNLFWVAPGAWGAIRKFAARRETFVKRTAFSLMAVLAVHDKDRPDDDFAKLLPLIERHADDDLNFVRKAVNWALRQIGKRSRKLNRAAIAAARRIAKQNSRAARWIACDALRELQNPKTLARIKK